MGGARSTDAEGLSSVVFAKDACHPEVTQGRRIRIHCWAKDAAFNVGPCHVDIPAFRDLKIKAHKSLNKTSAGPWPMGGRDG